MLHSYTHMALVGIKGLSESVSKTQLTQVALCRGRIC